MNTQTLNTVQPIAAGSDSAPVSMINMGGALALILLLIVAMAWVFRRTGIASRIVKGNNILSIKHTQAIGTRERLVVVEIDDKWLLLGVTPEKITNLMTMDKQECVENTEPAPLASSFQAALINCITQRKGASKK
ncbi:flagellar biosynthetic protein FliO [Salmonella enterica]